MTVSHAPFSLSTSSQVSTPESSSSDRPIKAVAVALTVKALPSSSDGSPAHSTSSTAKMASMIFSSRFILPISASRSLANCAELGVSLISGGQTKYSTSGISAKATSPGTSIAHAHVPHERRNSLPTVSAIRLTTSGLGAVAVMNIAEEIGLEW